MLRLIYIPPKTYSALTVILFPLLLLGQNQSPADSELHPVTSKKELDSLLKSKSKLFILYELANESNEETVYDFHFKDEAITEQINDGYTAIRISNTSPAGIYTAEKYGANALPSLLFIDEYGSLIHKRAGIPPRTQGVLDEFDRAESADASYRAFKNRLSENNILEPDFLIDAMIVVLNAGENADSIFYSFWKQSNFEERTDHKLWEKVPHRLSPPAQEKLIKEVKENNQYFERVPRHLLQKLFFDDYSRRLTGKSSSERETKKVLKQLEKDGCPYIEEFESLVTFRRLQATGSLEAFTKAAIKTDAGFDVLPPEVLTGTAHKVLYGSFTETETQQALQLTSAAEESSFILLLNNLLYASHEAIDEDEAVKPIQLPEDHPNRAVYRSLMNMISRQDMK